MLELLLYEFRGLLELGVLLLEDGVLYEEGVLELFGVVEGAAGFVVLTAGLDEFTAGFVVLGVVLAGRV